ncbi:hypothetical protein BDR07DRAFT_1455035 [Suillus spraguei]|nr:hypothetical protein BDR07DRAFT_1455035 [Suillus spraguei]
MTSNSVPAQSWPAASVQPPSEFKTEYHPRSGCPTLFQAFDEFHVPLEAQQVHIDKKPWHPFRSHADFEFSEIALDAALNKSQIDALLDLILHISQGHAEITLKNEADLSKAWDNAAAELTPFSKYQVPVTYKKNHQVYEVHAQPIWDWALDLLDNPLLVPHFVWYACCVYKRNATGFERFFDEPWTGDRWWDIQSSLPPNIDGAVPFFFILYANKTKLSSHGMVKGYPVVVQCANLLVHIQNGKGFGGDCVVGWLPIMNAGEEGKLGYTTLKHVVWHESFLKLLEHAAQYSKTGYLCKCHNDILCMMLLICDHGGKCPCPMCLVPLTELHDLSKTYPLRSVEEAKEVLHTYGLSKAQGKEILKALGLQPVKNIFWIILNSNPHDALSLDRLHSLHAGLWKHFLGELKKILALLGHEFQDLSKQTLYAGLNILMPRAFPEGYQLLRVISSYLKFDSWIGLDVHTESTLAEIEAELLVFDTELKTYVTHAKTSEIEDLKLDWDFPKMHLWKHIVCNIQHKGAARNYSTRPNEKLHGPLKDTYHCRTNGKDIVTQILHVDHHQFASKLLRECISALDEHHWIQTLSDNPPDEDIPIVFNGHVKLGSPMQHPSSIIDIENRNASNHTFQAFCRKLSEFINTTLPTYGHQLTSWLTFPADFQIHDRYFKVNYESMVDWKQVTDHLWCNPQFYGSPRFDHALIQLTAEATAFVWLVFLFRCHIQTLDPWSLHLSPLKLTHVKALPRACLIFVPLSSFIRGTVLVPDSKRQDEYIIVDHINSNMFLQMKA